MANPNLPTAEDVRAIIQTDLTDQQIGVFIGHADLLSRNCIRRLPADLQKTILTYLTAHLIQSAGMSTGEGFANVAVTSMRLGDASESYARAAVGTNLGGTYYGQQAIQLDPTGCLGRLGERKLLFKVL